MMLLSKSFQRNDIKPKFLFSSSFSIQPYIMVTPFKEQEIPAVYSLDQIETAIAEPTFAKDLIQGIQDGFVALEKGEFFACPIQTMGLPPFPFVETDNYSAQTCVKSGYFKGQDYYVIKVASGGHPMPKNSGLMQVFSQKTGKLEALLLDDGILTEVRTAAVGALAAQLLAPKTVECIGMVGTSVQARYQLRMLPTVTNCRKVLVWGRSKNKSEALCAELSKEGWDIQLVNDTDQLLKHCDLIVTTTCAREPLLGNDLSVLASRKKSGLHITCIGADAPGKVELAPELVAKADVLVADIVAQSLERGEFQKVVKDGLVATKSIMSLGNLIERKELHRGNEDDCRWTIFDSSGVALQDCVISGMTYEALQKKSARGDHE